MKKQPENDGAT